jgi:hypothetical protein
MTLDAGRSEASFALTLAGLPVDPGLAHNHSVTDSLLGVVIVPVPPKDGNVEVHGPTFAWALHGALALVAE